MKTENIGFKNELSFVCALLTGVAESSQVYPRITAEMFTSRELALIYKGIIELFNKGKAMDYTLVEHEMRALENDLYAEMNGLNYVADGLLSVVDDVHGAAVRPNPDVHVYRIAGEPAYARTHRNRDCRGKESE